jgi:hypothetical protein
MNDDILDPAASLRERLTRLYDEHHDLDEAIVRLDDTPGREEMLIRRMKKRKLALKDRIAALERMLKTDSLV